jgi:TetR/AcrR family transcriptional repressor of nem operon
MRYPASETAEKHEKILSEAARLFRERGFGGAGVADIMKAAGLTHGAFYAHFKSKEALAAEALAHALQESQARIEARVAKADDPKRSYLDGYLSRKHRDNPGQGCAMAVLGPEIARDPAVRAPLTAQVRRTLDWMAGRFRWKSKRAARQNAIHTLSATIGALILARAVDDPKLSDEILASMRESLADM